MATRMEGRRQRAAAALLVAAAVVLASSGCSLELPQGESGSIPFIPIFNQETGIRSVVPLGCTQQDASTHECTSVTPDQQPLVIVQIRETASRNDLIALVLDQTDIVQLPDPAGHYRGSALDWDLYGFETHLEDTGPTLLWLDLALAESDGDGYLVAMVTLPEDHESHAAWYDTVFSRVMYALSPLDG